MKKNTQLYTAQKLYDEIFAYCPKGVITNIHIDEDGYLNYTENGIDKEIDPNELCERMNMPLWEVCMVDNNGDDDFAIIMYEN